jgi:hypothetical protein
VRRFVRRSFTVNVSRAEAARSPIGETAGVEYSSVMRTKRQATSLDPLHISGDIRRELL